MTYEALPYDVVITRYGVWYGPAYTAPYSRDWTRFDDIQTFFNIVIRPEFILNVVSWKVREQ